MSHALVTTVEHSLLLNAGELAGTYADISILFIQYCTLLYSLCKYDKALADTVITVHPYAHCPKKDLRDTRSSMNVSDL